MRYSIERHAAADIVVRGLFLDKLPITRQGATEFTYSRFLVPYLSGFQGFSIFTDEDQVVVDDIGQLFAYCEADTLSHGERDIPAVWVMKKQPRFEWPSVMVFNNSACRMLTPEFVEDPANQLFDFAWAREVGEIPSEWNHYVGEHDNKAAKLYHYSRGIPYWEECRGYPEDEHWYEAYRAMCKSVDWIDLHANTRHFEPTLKRHLRQKYGVNA